MLSKILVSTLLTTLLIGAAVAQQPSPPAPTRPQPLSGPAPTVRDIAYARSDASTGTGHLLDLYLPTAGPRPVPVVVFTRGSGWMLDNGRSGAQGLAAQLNKAGYAVAGVSIRSSTQVRFPGQVHDIKAAIRWLRSNARKYNLDPSHIGIFGDSSGGWTSAMAAVTGDVPSLEGDEGVTGVSSAVQAAIAFYPPTDFLQMDRWAMHRCDPKADIQSPVRGAAFCHDGPESPESRLVGCPIQACPEKTTQANPVTYISPADPPIMIIHGMSDLLVPYNQGELFYNALNKACHESVFITMPVAGHGVWYRMLTDPTLAAAATITSTSSDGCSVKTPMPYTPSWATVIEFFDKYLK